jgi:hypothetical protein
MSGLLPWDNADRMRIGKVRVRGGTGGTTPQHALSAMLDRADLRPPGVPPAAVLIVRRMVDPLPGRLAPSSVAITVDTAWERAVRERLANLYRGAARPGRGPVPADAEAVVFADEGELLASLALDLAGGRISEHWWWRNFSGSFVLAASSPVASLLCDRAIWVPAALALLVQGRAVVVVRALAPREALAVVAAVSRVSGAAAVEAFATSSTMREAPSGLTASAPSADGVEGVVSGDRDTGRAPTPAEAAAREGKAVPSWRAAEAAPPWARCLPNGSAVPAELEREQKCLLGVALALHHRPEAVRSAAFAAALRSWWENTDREPRRSPLSPRSGSPLALPRRTAPETRDAAGLRRRAQPCAETGAAPAQSSSRTSAAAAAPLLAGDRAEISDLLSTSPPSPLIMPHTLTLTLLGTQEREGRKPPGGAGRISRSDGAPAPMVSAADHSAQSPSSKTGSTIPGDGPAPAVDSPLAATTHDTVAADDDWGLSLEEGVETALGGVLFLINLMCALDLPECFEEEWRLGSTVGAWGVLEALARALLAGDDDQCDDPIWPALAALSGRNAGERLGAGLPRRAAYRLPAEWVAHLPADGNEPWAWAARGCRLRLWSRGGYLLSETRRDALPAVAQADHEAQRWGVGAMPRERFGNAPLAKLSGPLIASIDHALKRWLSFVFPFLRWRLASALGIDPMEASLKDVVLARPGRLYVTATHVDLMIELETVSLPVRLAGLDRNPGWLGEFGRVIMFHFE